MKTLTRISIALSVILMLALAKVVWVQSAFRTDERTAELQRRAYLIEHVVTSPSRLVKSMPSGIGSQFQGEWALYSVSMLTKALANISRSCPDTKENTQRHIDHMIEMVLSSTMREYDRVRWDEDPLESLEGDSSHVSYLSHLAWMIGNYKSIGGGEQYDSLYHAVCGAMNRRIQRSPSLNLPTYPDECIYVPDMLVAIVALHQYAQFYNGKYDATVTKWMRRAKSEWIDKETGLLVSFLQPKSGEPMKEIKGSYSALNCYYLTLIDPEFAAEQYERLKATFWQRSPIAGIREYRGQSNICGLDIDSGPILFRLSPSGTAFAVGCATYYNDVPVRNNLLHTAELAGSTRTWNGKSHYLLADIAPVGEAIMLAMRTHHPN